MPTVAKVIVSPLAAVTEPDPVTTSQTPPATPPAPLLERKTGGRRFTEYMPLPMYCDIAGPLELPPVSKFTPPLPVPWTSQFSPAAGAAIVLAAKPRPSASTSRRARIGFALRDVISVLLFR